MLQGDLVLSSALFTFQELRIITLPAYLLNPHYSEILLKEDFDTLIRRTHRLIIPITLSVFKLNQANVEDEFVLMEWTTTSMASQYNEHIV